jgi:hypothetical protein
MQFHIAGSHENAWTQHDGFVPRARTDLPCRYGVYYRQFVVVRQAGEQVG